MNQATPGTVGADWLHALAMVLAGVLTIAYWVVYFTSGATHSGEDAVYLGFENSFPVADGYMSLCLFLSAIQLWRRREAAVFWGMAAGSAMIYLGCMDILFNLEHGKYFEGGGPMAAEATINLFCITFGPYTLVRLWMARDRLRSVQA